MPSGTVFNKNHFKIFSVYNCFMKNMIPDYLLFVFGSGMFVL